MPRLCAMLTTAIAIIPGLFCSTLLGQQVVLPDGPTPPKGPGTIGYVVVEEYQWDAFGDEPGRHMERAREAYLMVDAKDAAAELRKAAAQVRTAAAHGSERTKKALVKSEHELEQLARQAEMGTLKSIEEFDLTVSRASHALANDQYVKAAEAWRQKELKLAGKYLKASVNNLELAAARTDASIRQSTAVVAKDTRLISGKLIDGTGYVLDEVGVGFESVGHAIEKVGAKVEGTHLK